MSNTVLTEEDTADIDIERSPIMRSLRCANVPVAALEVSEERRTVDPTDDSTKVDEGDVLIDVRAETIAAVSN